MASVDNDFNYFPRNQLNRFSACSLSNKNKQLQPNKFKSGGTNNERATQAEKEFELLYAELSQ